MIQFNILGSSSTIVASSITDTALTSGRVVLAGTGGLLKDDSGLTYTGTGATFSLHLGNGSATAPSVSLGSGFGLGLFYANVDVLGFASHGNYLGAFYDEAGNGQAAMFSLLGSNRGTFRASNALILQSGINHYEFEGDAAVGDVQIFGYRSGTTTTKTIEYNTNSIGPSVPLAVRGQGTVNVQEWRSSAGAVLAAVKSTGDVLFGGNLMKSSGGEVIFRNSIDTSNSNVYGNLFYAGSYIRAPLIYGDGTNCQVGNVSSPVTKFYVAYTNTATVGAVTINNPTGRVNIAAAGTSVVVTNSLVTAASHVFAVVSQADATAYVKNVVPAAGSFTITLGAAATAQVSIDFFVVNAD